MCLAVPGKITDLFDREGLPMANVDFAGLRRAVCLFHVPEARVGDYVLVHVGFALSVIDEEEAKRTLELLDEIAGASEMEAALGPSEPPS